MPPIKYPFSTHFFIEPFLFGAKRNPIQTKNVRYSLFLQNEEIALEWTALTEIPPHPAQKKNWLESVLLPKLNSIFANGLSENTAAAQGFPETLSLVDKPRYQEIYNRMKSKYGLDLVKDWPEVTDPQKFVFEDIAIASYLLALWERLDVKGKIISCRYSG